MQLGRQRAEWRRIHTCMRNIPLFFLAPTFNMTGSSGQGRRNFPSSEEHRAMMSTQIMAPQVLRSPMSPLKKVVQVPSCMPSSPFSSAACHMRKAVLTRNDWGL